MGCLGRQTQTRLLNDSDYATPSASESTHPNILVLGPRGGGVSSVVNIIAGKQIAKVSNDSQRCTQKISSYQVELRDAGPGKTIPINLYDIPSSDDQVINHLEFPTIPVTLAIVCTQDLSTKVRATADYLGKEHRWSRQKDGKVPVLVVITHSDPNPDPGWWEKNKMHFSSVNAMNDHVCLSMRGKTEDSRTKLHSLIIKHMLPSPVS